MYHFGSKEKGTRSIRVPLLYTWEITIQDITILKVYSNGAGGCNTDRLFRVQMEQSPFTWEFRMYFVKYKFAPSVPDQVQISSLFRIYF